MSIESQDLGAKGNALGLTWPGGGEARGAGKLHRGLGDGDRHHIASGPLLLFLGPSNLRTLEILDDPKGGVGAGGWGQPDCIFFGETKPCGNS